MHVCIHYARCVVMCHGLGVAYGWANTGQSALQGARARPLLSQHWNTDAIDHIASELTETMHYRSTHTQTRSHTHPSFSFQWISMHAHTPHHKWWDLNINSMKYSCVSASRSSRTTTEGDLPSDLRILLHSSLSLFLQLSLPLLCCGIPSHCHGVVYQRVPRYCSSSLWYRLNTCKVLLCMCLGVGVGVGGKSDTLLLGLLYSSLNMRGRQAGRASQTAWESVNEGKREFWAQDWML